MSKKDWVLINQRYLLAAIQEVKAELLLYQNKEKQKSHTFAQALELSKRELKNIEDELLKKAPLDILVDVFQLTPFERKILLMCVGVELDAQFANLISDLQGDGFQPLPTFSLALSALEGAHWSALTPEGPLRYWALIEITKNSLLANARLSVDEYILHYLSGIQSIDTRLNEFTRQVTLRGNLVKSHQEVAEKLTQHLTHFNNSGQYPLIHLRGSSHEDKLAIVVEAFTPYIFSTYLLSIRLLPANFKVLSDFILLWNRDTLLNRYVLFIDGTEWDTLDQTQKHYVKHLIEEIQGIVVLGNDQPLSSITRALLTIEVNKPQKEEQEELWKEQLGSYAKGSGGELGKVVTQFNLEAHTIRRLAKLATVNPSSNGSKPAYSPKFKEHLWKVCCQYNRPNLESLAQRIDALATWEDLVLPETQKLLLKEIATQVQQRQKVYYEWGFARKTNRGLGISALFTGESGTGKTMASEVLANELKLDLYRIDLSQVVNKYIGETEKNLGKIFDAVEGSGAILLFDEADALFGKRSEVKDSHDRYSNIEVSYLLQKMEEYRGLAILTTNLKNALDQAFLRRIRFVAEFPFPDKQMRAEIWKRAFPVQTPTSDLNIERLAFLNIPGGNIKNIAMNAAFVAAGKNQPITMADIQQCARNEYLKLEKQMSSNELLI